MSTPLAIGAVAALTALASIKAGSAAQTSPAMEFLSRGNHYLPVDYRGDRRATDLARELEVELNKD